MNGLGRPALAVLTILLGMQATAQQPLLQLQGQPWFGGSMTLHVTAPEAVGQPVILAMGLDPLPLDAPVPSSKGPFFIGSFLSASAIGVIPGNGRLDLPFAMPPMIPGAAGMAIAMQAYVSPQLSGPASLPLDIPYFTSAETVVVSSPEPAVQALFGDSWAVGDLNADGYNELVVGAWFEDVAGIDKAGRVYILWGPSFTSYAALQSSAPVVYGTYGAAVIVADMTSDGTDDLVVVETPGDPPGAEEVARIHIFRGGPQFTTTPEITIQSPGAGAVYSLYGRATTVGDFNADGHADLATGNVKEVVNGKAEAGRLDVFWGPEFTTLLTIPNPTPLAGDFFGSSLATADVNGDGIDDLIEGSGRADGNGIVNVGRVHVYLGPLLTLGQTISNPLPQGFNSRFGEEVRGSDLNGDGMSEVIACDLKNRVYIYWSPDFTSYTDVRKPEALNTIALSQTSYGYFIAAEDVNGDGLVDLLIADPFEGLTACANAKEGTVFLALAPYYSTFHVLRGPEPACGDDFGWRMGVADINNDGRSDVVSGSETTDVAGIQNSGRVVIHLGSQGASR